MYKKLASILLRLFLVLSPLPVLIMVGQFSPPGVVLGMPVIFGIPLIALIGLTVTYVWSKHKQATKISVIGFLIPASLVWLWQVFQ